MPMRLRNSGLKRKLSALKKSRVMRVSASRWPRRRGRFIQRPPGAGEVAAVRDAADVLRRERRDLADRTEAAHQAAREPLVALAGRELQRLDAIPQLARELHAPLVIFQGVRSQVEAVYIGVDADGLAESRVFVGAVGEAGLGRARRDLASSAFSRSGLSGA